MTVLSSLCESYIQDCLYVERGPWFPESLCSKPIISHDIIYRVYAYPCYPWGHPTTLNTLRLIQNGRHFPDHIFKCIFSIVNIKVSITFSLKFVASGPIIYIPALVQIMAWRRPGDKLVSELSKPMMVSFLAHICVTGPQWVKCEDMTRNANLFLRFLMIKQQVKGKKIVMIQLFCMQ